MSAGLPSAAEGFLPYRTSGPARRHAFRTMPLSVSHAVRQCMQRNGGDEHDVPF